MRKAQQIIKGMVILDNYDIEIGVNSEGVVVDGAGSTTKEDHESLKELGWEWSEDKRTYTFVTER